MLVSDISSELTRIWDSLEGTNKMRACLFNLVLFTEQNERTNYVQTIAQKVIERFPSRVIFITVDKKSKEDLLQANVSIMTGAKGEYDVVCDYIEFAATSSSLPKVPFALLPHLIADLPVYLVWEDNPCRENPMAHQMEKLATRIIFDSETTDNLFSFAASVLEHHAESGCDIADLNWARLENWRELLASVFHSEERLKQLQRTRKVRIVYNAFETPFFCHTKIQAIYLQGWLSAQMGWKLTGCSKEQFIYGDKVFELSPASHQELPPGTVVSFELETSEEEHFSFCRMQEAPHQINMIFSTREKCSLPSRYIFTKSQSGLSLVNEICHSGTSRHYLKLMNALKEIDPKCLC